MCGLEFVMHVIRERYYINVQLQPIGPLDNSGNQKKDRVQKLMRSPVKVPTKKRKASKTLR
jgi:hypothetical protein